ncbi:hypothetical protein [Pleionea litopenaei]|uniref:Uncharacterized protein n=1 Tax=Pleionea litopenaei TaxID=3070815 RepID=A0AA51X6N7_9GAMM|nr:hypothetical protein [Pleionea sp. HL-JVS1]WMS86275.1 hypothetical protein Q9312_13705 [Pleionea sp. HL-JVS1]
MLRVFFASSVAITLSLFLAACGGGAANNQQGPLSSEPLAIYTYANSNPNDRNQMEFRKNYGAKITNELKQRNLFSTANYIGDGQDISGQKVVLRVTFLYLTNANGDWPMEAKVHYLLERDGESIFNRVYRVEATRYNAATECAGCDAKTTVLTMLNKKVVPDLTAELSR